MSEPARRASPKRHHYVPILHLKHFTGPEPQAQVWTYDAETDNAWSAIPDETGLQSHYYSVELADGTMNTQIEDELSKIESKAAPIYEALLRGEIPQDSERRTWFAIFLAFMYARSPAARRMAGELMGRGMQIMSYAYASNDAAFEKLVSELEEDRGEKMGPKIKEEVRQHLIDPSNFTMSVPQQNTLMSFTVVEKLTHMLFNMRWTLCHAEHGFFVTSDSPLVRWSDPKTYHSVYGDGGFQNQSVEVTFPLSPKFLLLLTWRENGPEAISLDRSSVDNANLIRAANSDRYLYAHIKHKEIQKLTRRFKDVRPGMITEGFGPKRFAEIEIVRRSKKSATPVSKP